MRLVHLAIIAIIGVSIFFVVATLKKKQDIAAAPPTPAANTPKTFLDPTVMPADAIRAGDAYLDMWVPDPGWQVAVESITPESGGTKALRIAVSQPTPLYGQMWLVAVVDEFAGIDRGEFCTITGRIDEVSRFNDGGPVEATRLVLRDAVVTKNISRGR
jgi:hypothetical protein